MDLAGEILKEGNVPTEEAAALVPDVDTAVVLEATGSWHFAYDALVATGATVKLAHPARVKAIASARVKTDKIDARILAHLLRSDLIPEAWAPPQTTRELRDLVRLRWRFVTQRTTAKNRISNLLARECLRFPGSDMFGKSGRAWLAAQDLSVHTCTMVSMLLASIDEADAHVASLTARLHELLDGDFDMHLLMSIPGVGFITAATLVAELGDWRRFSHAKQVSAYFGIIPSVRASASVAHYGRITRAGKQPRQACARGGRARRRQTPGSGAPPLPVTREAAWKESRARRRSPRAARTVLDPPAQGGGVSGGSLRRACNALGEYRSPLTRLGLLAAV
jgi:transposase